MRKFFILTLIILSGICQVNAQSSFGIGTDSPDANAIFEAQSTDKGILIPRLTTTQRNGITGLGGGQEGLMIYNTITDQFNYWDGAAWVAFPNTSAGDIDFYEVGTTTAPNAITDNIFTQGNVGIGEITPAAALHIDGGTIPFRVEISGIEKMRLNNNTLEFLNTNNSVFVGENAGIAQTSGMSNTGIGSAALVAITTGSGNTALGYQTLFNNYSGINNTAVGRVALYSNTSGSYNVANGTFALYSNIDGSNNTASGYYALSSNSTGTQNVAIGSSALNANISGSDNVAIGNQALGANTSANNVAIGSQSLLGNASGSRNVGVGYRTGYLNLTGSRNTFIGYDSGNSNTGSDNVFIGYQSGNTTTGTSQLWIENSNSTIPLIFGSFSTNEVGINWQSAVPLPNTLSVNGNASKNAPGSWLANSDSRLKKNIEYLESKAMLNKVLQMKGVTYQWNDDKTGMDRPEGIQYGFIAQDLQIVWPTKVSEDGQGYLQTAYGDFDAMLVESIKALNAENEQLKNELQTIKELLEQVISKDKSE